MSSFQDEIFHVRQLNKGVAIYGRAEVEMEYVNRQSRTRLRLDLVRRRAHSQRIEFISSLAGAEG